MKALFDGVEKNRQLILQAERWIWQHPETGYREEQTSKYLEEKYKELGYELVMAKDIPGFYTVVDTGRPGPTILVLGELDSLVCANHPDSNEKGYVHACGHNAQSACLLGIAAALKEPNAIDGLCGKIKLCAVPAEELIEIEYRKELLEKGVIHYLGGKPEFLYRGYFDDVDIAFMVHTSTNFSSVRAAVGCIAKNVIYKGVAAHAGGSPWNGKNALYAATQGLTAVNALRETFKESDRIRFHPIIKQGGQAVNAIPETVTIETYVRGISFEAILEANKKINLALTGAALSIGCNVEIIDIPGYAPFENNVDLCQIAKEAGEIAIPEIPFNITDNVSTGSTDMGDLACVMPIIHPYIPGAQGTSHGKDYNIVDPEMACVKNAKWQLAMLYLLLKDEGKRAKEVIANFTPQFKSKQEYFEFLDKNVSRKGDRIIYVDDKAQVTL